MIEQRSDEWFAMRLGKVTASRISDLMARTRSGYGASRANYEAQLVAERLTGTVQDSYSNAAMKWGTETEPQARAAYEFARDVDVIEIAFVEHPTIANSGASPDGLVGGDGLVEIKCPNTATHIETLLGGSIPDKYVLQCLWQMACTGRKWCDLASFDPRLPPSMQLVVHRIERDEKAIAEIEKEVAEFLRGVEQKVSALRAKFEEAA
jgi:putative phage-type endonuclease